MNPLYLVPLTLLPSIAVIFFTRLLLVLARAGEPFAAGFAYRKLRFFVRADGRDRDKLPPKK
jgi:hypothetical protein